MRYRSWPELNDEVRESWDENAAFWDQQMGEGNAFHSRLIAPAVERLLAIRPGERVFDVACGNGQFARRLAELGATVRATDIAPRMIEAAKTRTAARPELAERIRFDVMDATDEAAWNNLQPQSFDAAVCLMAMMDMADVAPMLRGLRRALKPEGRFTFAVLHPCFNHAGMRLAMEESTVDGQVVEERSVRIVTYASNGASQGVAMIGQPRVQWYFDRTLAELLSICFTAGFVLDGIEEPAFDQAPADSRAFGRLAMTEIPPVLACRLRSA